MVVGKKVLLQWRKEKARTFTEGLVEKVGSQKQAPDLWSRHGRGFFFSFLPLTQRHGNILHAV
jgi:hypothetical protein